MGMYIYVALSSFMLLDGVFRENYASVIKSGVVPSIPVQPIGYGDALYFMRYQHLLSLQSLVVIMGCAHALLQSAGHTHCTHQLDWRT